MFLINMLLMNSRHPRNVFLSRSRDRAYPSLQNVNAVLDATISMERNPRISGVVSRSQPNLSFLGYTNQREKRRELMCMCVFFVSVSSLLISLNR